MKFPFAKKTGFAAAPKNPAVYGAAVNGFLAGLSDADKLRVLAATKTEHGDLEMRVRILKDGSQMLSLWLCLRGTDEAIKLVPAPPEQEAQHGGA